MSCKTGGDHIWGEGYDGENGWAITPHGSQFDAAYRNKEEADDLLDILEHEVIPLYYQRSGHGLSSGWVRKSKASMKTILPRFNSQRMVMDYVLDYYAPASKQSGRLSADGGQPAKLLAEWKNKVLQNWAQVSIRRIDDVCEEITQGESLPIRIAAKLAGLEASDVCVECLVGTESERGKLQVAQRQVLSASGTSPEGETLFSIDLEPDLPGLVYYKLRMYPYHELLTHPFELGCMLWV